MCGIAGIIDPIAPPDLELLRSMAGPLEKRGPDDFGYYLNDSAGLVHRRLSVIDIEGGKQPIYNEDRNLIIVFNGEIYNHQSLREKLTASGHQFKSSCDTEVLVHLYEEQGPEMLNSLNGMFAFAIYNEESGELFLARDRFGQKPLFYSQAGNRLAFASGPASIAKLSWVDREIDCSAIHDYLEYQYVPTPRSIYTGIRKLPPGHWAVWKDGEMKSEQYWRPRVCGDYPNSYSEAAEELNYKLHRAVKNRLVADVPVGLFLSGGIDSSLICALAQEHLPESAHTFSIGFPEKKYDEREYAQIVAQHLGTQHHFLEVNPNDFERLRQIVSSFEEPFCDASMLPTSLLSQFTREHVTVALSGDGADELFGGYYRYRIMHLCRYLCVCPSPLRKTIKRLLLSILPPRTEERTFWGRIRRLVEISDTDGLEQYLRLISRCPSTLKERLYGQRLREQKNPRDSVEVLAALAIPGDERSGVDAIMETDLKSYLNDDILVKVDRASMAYGLEVRSPFLDVEVAELAMSLPYKWKQRGMQRKRILVDTFRSHLPDAIVNRPKMGFGVPIARWLRSDWRDQVQSLLLEGSLVRDGFFLRDSVESLLTMHCKEQADYSYTIFALLILELWIQERIE